MEATQSTFKRIIHGALSVAEQFAVLFV
jgi:hypothetical protein